MCIIFRIILDGQHILILYYYVIWNMHVKYGLDVQTKAQKKLEKLQVSSSENSGRSDYVSITRLLIL